MNRTTAARTDDSATASDHDHTEHGHHGDHVDHVAPRQLAGEVISIPERMIVAPSVGRFRLTCVAFEGAFVDEGQEIGVIEGPSASQSVRSPFAGRLMGVLAHPGERLRAGEPVAWLRAS